MYATAKNYTEFVNCFRSLDGLDNNRQDEKVLYPLQEVLFLTLVAVLSYAESWKQIHDYGVAKIDFLRKYMPFNNGIPSKSTICTVMGLIDKNKFESWFTQWSQSLLTILPDELINIDGKTIKGSRTKEEKATHILNAFANKAGIVIGQRTVGEKTNEIPEIPKLLDDLNIAGATITIDPLGCQKKIVAKIIEKKANYFIGLKGNQASLYEDAKYLFADKSKAFESYDYCSERNRGHGRIEWRKCWSTELPPWFQEQHSAWVGLKSISLIESERHIGSNRSIEQRLYISSAPADAKLGLNNSRRHWSFENQVHHVLDVTFNEDASRIHNAAENMSVIRKMALNLVKKFKAKTNNKASIPSIRKKSVWSENVASAILNHLFE